MVVFAKSISALFFLLKWNRTYFILWKTLKYHSHQCRIIYFVTKLTVIEFYSQGWAVKRKEQCDWAWKILNCVLAKALNEFWEVGISLCVDLNNFFQSSKLLYLNSTFHCAISRERLSKLGVVLILKKKIVCFNVFFVARLTKTGGV